MILPIQQRANRRQAYTSHAAPLEQPERAPNHTSRLLSPNKLLFEPPPNGDIFQWRQSPPETVSNAARRKFRNGPPQLDKREIAPLFGSLVAPLVALLVRPATNRESSKLNRKPSSPARRFSEDSPPAQMLATRHTVSPSRTATSARASNQIHLPACLACATHLATPTGNKLNLFPFGLRSFSTSGGSWRLRGLLEAVWRWKSLLSLSLLFGFCSALFFDSAWSWLLGLADLR